MARQRRSRYLLLAFALGLWGCASLEAADWAERGSRAIDQGRFDQAIADLERAVALAPEAAPLHNNLGVAYLAAGRAGEARQAFEQAVALDCDHEPAQRNLRSLGPPTGAVASGPEPPAPAGP